MTAAPRPLSVLVLPALLFLVLLLPATSAAQAPEGAAGSEPVREPTAERAVCATILSTGDLHGRLHPRSPDFARGRLVGGVAALGAHLARERERAAAEGCPAFLLDAGDLLHGSPISYFTRGETVVAAFEALGYDAVAIGNHEFDWGLGTLRERMAEAGFPFLAANLFVTGTDRRPPWARPWTVLERDGVRVGVVGLALPSTPVATLPAHVAGLSFRSMARALERAIPEVRARGVDFVVVLMHAGAFCRAAGCEGEAIDALQATREPFDYAVAGHTHARVETQVTTSAGEAPVVQAYAYGTAYAVGRLERRADGAVSRRLLGVRTTWADEVEPDPALARLVEAAWEGVRDTVERVVARLEEPLPRRGPGGEHGLGRLIADAQRAATGAQVAIVNDGGIRRDLPAGPVTWGDLYELQPYGNELLVLEVDGATLLRALEHALDDEGDVRAQVSGVEVRYDPDAPEGSRVPEAVLPDGAADGAPGAGGGEPVRADGRYTLAANAFMATGGGGYRMLRDAAREPSGVLDLEALVDHLAALPGPVRAPPSRRWIPKLPASTTP